MTKTTTTRGIKRGGWAVLLLALVLGLSSTDAEAAGKGQPADWDRFYHYPYVYYPHNFVNQANRSYDSLYYRYDQERRIPVYNTGWHNFYPSKRPYHSGHHFILDVF